MDLAATLAEIKKLPVDDRLWLVHEIWEDIAAEPESVRLSDAQKRELDRRIAHLDANPDDVISWEELKFRLKNRRP